MDISTTSYSRVRRSTAGFNKRYDEQDYVLVSFPNLNKHSIIPAACVTVDPLDKQNGSIKTFGSRKNLRIIGGGSKEVMKERASRYAASAGSEEVELALDEQENDENQSINEDDDDYSPSPVHRSIKEIKKRVVTNEQSKSQIEIISSNINEQPVTTVVYDGTPNPCLLKKNPLVNRQLNFDRVYPSPTTGTKRNYKDNDDNDNDSSLSGSDETDIEWNKKSTSIIKKDNELQVLLKKPRRKRKKQVIESVRNMEGPCIGCIKYQEELSKLSKRVDKLEKVIPVVKKFRSKPPSLSTNQITTSCDNNQIYARIKEVTDIDPNQLRSTLTRPTIVMRELIKKAGHINDKVYLNQHEELFKQFIQMKCMILDENIEDQWKEIKESLSRQHIDEENNRKRRSQIAPTLIITDTTLPQVTHASTTNNEQEVSLAPVFESS